MLQETHLDSFFSWFTDKSGKKRMPIHQVLGLHCITLLFKSKQCRRKYSSVYQFISICLFLLTSKNKPIHIPHPLSFIHNRQNNCTENRQISTVNFSYWMTSEVAFVLQRPQYSHSISIRDGKWSFTCIMPFYALQHIVCPFIHSHSHCYWGFSVLSKDTSTCGLEKGIGPVNLLVSR